MSLDIGIQLQENYTSLLQQYNSNLEDVLALQTTLIHDILPNLADELQLDEDSVEWTKEWLQDTASMFRLLRHNKFTRSFAMESIRKNIMWRLDELWPRVSSPHLPNRRRLLRDIRDPYGRPIIIMNAQSLDMNLDELKLLIIQEIEYLRAYLRHLNERPTHSAEPVLQYVVLLDLNGILLRNISFDFITWALREAVPRFPGMLAAVLMINYSWAHSGAWSLVKRVLPASAMSRVFFPTKEELLNYFSPSSLPLDYGGTLPSLSYSDNPLQSHQDQSISNIPLGSNPSSSISSTISHPVQRVQSVTAISPMSLLNPFFGYPVSFTRGSPPSLNHGRRRKRDLIQTLILLLWKRWRREITVCLSFTFIIILLRTRKLFLGSPKGLLAWKAFLSSAPVR